MATWKFLHERLLTHHGHGVLVFIFGLQTRCCGWAVHMQQLWKRWHADINEAMQLCPVTNCILSAVAIKGCAIALQDVLSAPKISPCCSQYPLHGSVAA